MTEADTNLRDRVLDRADDLRDVLHVLLGQANRRQLWLVFMEESGRIGDPIMPMADYPADPHEETEADDLGVVDQGHLLMHRIGMLREATGNASVVLVWERVAPNVLDGQDRAWASAMADEAAALGVPLRAQFLLHNRGLRQLHPDDYM
ncbi:hypothetical protein [Microbacterium sp. CIAB417]|uniref:hypothetical protein n=1 Tax=Microbacterium sp. CIAB417 TaxID=2860287 RepID=UPI001FAC8A6A|nr:hypothetical protein [Microbacterium sp. CIAB417]